MTIIATTDGFLLNDHSQRFIQLALKAQALKFGSFTLKSGRQSPYFFNAGVFADGSMLHEVASCYADVIEQSSIQFDMLFGPAYKGIPLATALACILHQRGKNHPVAFDRKEAKKHGEGGQLIGSPIRGRVLIVDDVLTAGTAVRASVARIQEAGGEVAGVLLLLDRQERGQTDASAASELSQSLNAPVLSVSNLKDLLTFTQSNPAWNTHHQALTDYRTKHAAVD